MPLPTDCPADCGFAAWRWARRWFGDCVCSSRDAASFALGLVSVFAWGVAELPQIVANFRNGATDGVSFAFIATWLTGDALNLVGCAMSPTLPTQLYTAIVYTSTTVVLIAQHVAYGRGAAAKEDAGPLDAPLEARLLVEVPDPGRDATTTATTRAIRVPVDVEASGGFVPNETNAAGRVGRPAAPRDAPPRRRSGDPRSLSSARTLAASGSWSGSARGPARARDPQRRSRSEQTRRRSVGTGSAAVGALAAALGVAACVALIVVVAAGPGKETSEADGGGGSAPRFRDARGGDRFADGLEGARGRVSSAAEDDVRGDASAPEPLVQAPAWVGQALGWSMAAIYLGGRVPQILLNRERGSAEGLSASMFAWAVLGNLTYGSSILARSTRWSRVRPNLPWLCDAALCLAMDAVILWQHSRYVPRGDARGGDDGGGAAERATPEGDAARSGSIGSRGVARPIERDASRRHRSLGESFRTDDSLRAGYVALSASEGSETREED